MKKIFLESVVLLISAFTLCGAGIKMPFYSVELKVDCGTPAEAAAAALKFLPLPEGKKAAFSCRWDDSSPAHLRTLAAMKKYGYKGTFYLAGTKNQNFWEKVAPQLCRDGFSVGNHTLGHKHLPFLTPGMVNTEILLWNILLESRMDRTVTLLVIPFGQISSPFYENVALMIGRCIQRSGIIGGADISPKLYARYGLPQKEFFTPRLIAPGDRDADCARFDAQIARHLKSGDSPLYITLGIHSWHTDKGLENLGRSMKKYGNDPQWWYCNAADYSAYRFMALNSRIKSKKVKGSSAFFTVELPDPAFLGSNVALWGECAGKRFAIPHTRKLPVRIALADPAGKNGKFTGVKSSLKLTSAGLWSFSVENAGAPLEDVALTFRLPVEFESGVWQINAGKIGKSASFTAPAAFKQSAAAAKDINLAAVQMDFTRSGEKGRIWTVLTWQSREKAENHVLKFSTREFSPEELLRLSSSSVPLENSFAAVEHLAGWRPGAFQIRLKDKKSQQKKVTAVLEFTGKGKMTLQGALPSQVCFNGKVLKTADSKVSFDAPQGKCRLVLVYPPFKRSWKNIVLKLN